jgi:hypothetical protein
MKHAIRITSDRIDSPDLNRVVACLLALALAELEAERADNAEHATEEDCGG